MTGCTRVMHLGIARVGQRRRIGVTVGTGSRLYLHQRGMIRRYRRMRRGPAQAVTRLAVAGR